MSALRAELVAKLIEKYGWEQAVTETAVAEFIEKFATLKVMINDMDSENLQLEPSKKLNKVWKMIDAEDPKYSDLCDFFPREEKVGEEDPSYWTQQKNKALRYKNTLLAYKVLFGANAPEAVWDDAEPVYGGGGCGGGASHGPVFPAKWVKDLPNFYDTGLTVGVHTATQARVDIDIVRGMTFGDLKIQIESRLNVPRAHQILYFDGTRAPRDDDFRVGDLAVVDGTDFYVVAFDRNRTGGMNITVRTLTGKRLTLQHVQLGDSVHILKLMIEETEGIPIDQQRIIFAGKQLEDNRTVADYNVQNGDVMDLVLRLRGC